MKTILKAITTVGEQIAKIWEQAKKDHEAELARAEWERT